MSIPKEPRASAEKQEGPCTGSGWQAADRQGMWMGTGVSVDGECGICGQRVRIDSDGRCVTHPRERASPEAPPAPTDALPMSPEQRVRAVLAETRLLAVSREQFDMARAAIVSLVCAAEASAYARGLEEAKLAVRAMHEALHPGRFNSVVGACVEAIRALTKGNASASSPPSTENTSETPGGGPR